MEVYLLLPVPAHISVDAFAPSCFKRAKGWLKHCMEQRSESRLTSSGALLTCVNADRTDEQKPCLYEPCPGATREYAALSYCWGSARFFTITLSTLLDCK